MLGDVNLTTMVAVKDLADAVTFFEKTVGLTKVGENPGGVQFRSGTGSLNVYESEFAGTNKATTAAWTIDDIDETVGLLKAKGVPFEHYDNLPDTVRDGDIHVAGGFKIAWFKDATGNIFEINNGT